MVHRMAGGLDAGEGEFRGPYRIAFGHDRIRRVVEVNRGVEPADRGLHAVARRSMRRAADDPGSGRRPEGARARRMIPMRMGYENGDYGFAAESVKQSGDMVLLVRAGIDDRDLPVADDIGAGAGEGHRAGVAGDHPPNQRRKSDELARLDREGAVEGDVLGLRFRVSRFCVHRKSGGAPVSGLGGSSFPNISGAVVRRASL